MKSRIMPALLAFIALFAATTFAAGRMKIRLNTTAEGADVSENVYNFPVLVHLDAATFPHFAEVADAKTGLKFTKSDGTSPLYFDIDEWNAATNSADIWVRIDTVYANSNAQFFYMQYGAQTDGSMAKSGAVFGAEAGFLVAAHFNENIDNTTPVIHQSSVYDTFGTVSRDVDSTDSLYGSDGGVVGKAVKAAGDGHILFPRRAKCETGFTFSIWFRPRTTSSFMASLIREENWRNRLSYGRNSDAKLKTHIWLNKFHQFPNHSRNNFVTLFSNNLRVNRWHLATVAADNAARYIRLFADGAVVDSVFWDEADGIRAHMPDADNFAVASGWAQGLNAFVDEARMYNQAKSCAWVKLEYENAKPGMRRLITVEEDTAGVSTRQQPVANAQLATSIRLSARNMLHIASAFAPINKAALVSGSGRIMLQQKPRKKIACMDLSRIPSGIYVLAIQSGRRLEKRTIAVSHQQ